MHGILVLAEQAEGTQLTPKQGWKGSMRLPLLIISIRAKLHWFFHLEGLKTLSRYYTKQYNHIY